MVVTQFLSLVTTYKFHKQKLNNENIFGPFSHSFQHKILRTQNMTQTICSGLSLVFSFVMTNIIHVMYLNIGNLFGLFSLSLWGKNICNKILNTDDIFHPSLSRYKVNIHAENLNKDNIFVLFSLSLWRKICT